MNAIKSNLFESDQKKKNYEAARLISATWFLNTYSKE